MLFPGIVHKTFRICLTDTSLSVGTWSGAFRAVSHLYKEGGVLGLLQGHSATLLRIFPYAAIKFVAYDQLEHVIILSNMIQMNLVSWPSLQVLMPTPDKHTNTRRFTAGALSGTSSGTVYCRKPC